MQIVQVMVGYSFGGVDLLCCVMGKKIKEVMDVECFKFEVGVVKNGVDKKKVFEVFDFLEKFVNYGFNKLYVVVYVVVLYQIGWFKVNYLVEFMVGVMNCDIYLIDKLLIYVEEVWCGLDIEIILFCVNWLLVIFDVVDQKLVYVLGVLKNVGIEVMEMIVCVCGEDDKFFVSLFDFVWCVDLKCVGKCLFEMLVWVGVFDQFDSNCCCVFESFDFLVQYFVVIYDQKVLDQVLLFGDVGEDLLELCLLKVSDWVFLDWLMEEQKVIGFFLLGYLLDDYVGVLKCKKILIFVEVQKKVENEGVVVVQVGVMVLGFCEMKLFKGNCYFWMNILDLIG